jgi:hypothetical protein
MGLDALANTLGGLFALLTFAAVQIFRNLGRAGREERQRRDELRLTQARNSALEAFAFACLRTMAAKNVYPPKLPPELTYLLRTDDLPADDASDPDSPAAILRAFMERERASGGT